MTAPITPDERAAMRERHTASRGAVQRGVAALTDVPRLLDALDTAEADLDGFANAVSQWKRRALDAEAEVARLRAATSPAWDEDTVTEDVARAMFPHHFTDDRQPLRVFTETRSDAELREAERAAARRKARQALAVVREHLPVRPDREAVRLAQHRALMPQAMSIFAAVGGTQADYDALLDTLADAVLAEWPGESRATVQAEALHDAAEAARRCWTGGTNLPEPCDPEAAYSFDRWLDARADRLEKGADRG